MQRDEEGDTYYFNAATGASQWDRPLPPKAPKSTGARSGLTFQGLAPSSTGSGVKSTLVRNNTPGRESPKAQIETVESAGGPDDACGSFEANPFKPEMCKRCRKLKGKHTL